MPDVDGLDLAARIRARLPDLPIVLASSVSQHDVAADPRWATAGIEAVVMKPIKASPLHGALATVLGTSLDDAEAATTSAFDETLAAAHPLRILLAEDNVVNQKLAIRLLEKLGYRADVAGNGIEAIEALERQPYDLLLSDVQMPEMDGLEATRRILRALARGSAAVDRRDDGRGDERRPRAVPRRRHERLPHEADPRRGARGGDQAGPAPGGRDRRAVTRRPTASGSTVACSRAWPKVSAATPRSSRS